MDEQLKDDKGPKSRAKIDLSEEVFPGSEPISTLERRHPLPGDIDSKYAKLLAQFQRRMETSWGFWNHNWIKSRDDLDFCYKDQWDPRDRQMRNKDQRPTLSINLLPQFVNHVVGQIHQSKFSINVKQKGTVDDKVPLVSNPKQKLTYSEIMSGIIKDIEQRSNAPYAYARAGQHAVESGYGWLYVRTMKTPQDPRNLELRIEHIADRFSVMFDALSEDSHFRDADWAAISKRMDYHEFAARYPEHAASDAGGGYLNYEGFGSGVQPMSRSSYRDWWGDEGSVRVTDYYHFVPVDRVAVTYKDQMGHEVWDYERNLEGMDEFLVDKGYVLVDKQEVRTKQLMYSRLLINRVIEEPQEVPSNIIPIVPVFGRIMDIGDGYKELAGTIRFAKDSQRMLNSFASAAAERVADSPKQPFIATAKQIKGHEEKWKNMKRPAAVLPYNVDNAAPNVQPTRIMQSNRATGEFEMIAFAKQTVMDTTGIHEAERGIKSNETSGLAIMRRQEAGGLSTLEFLDNLAHSISLVGDILCDMIPKIYSGDHLQKIVLPDDTEAQIHINHLHTADDGTEIKVGNIGLARYHCNTEAGAMSSTEREKFLDMMIELGKTNPAIFSVGMDLIMNNIDVPGAKALARRMKMMVPRQVLSQEEVEGMPEQQPTPEQQTILAKAEADKARAQADVRIAQMNTEQAKLKLEQQASKTEAVEVQSEDKIRESGTGGGDLKAEVERLVKEALSDQLAGLDKR